MWQEYICAVSIDDALQTLAKHGENARVVAGGTDLVLEIENGVRKDIHSLVDVTRVVGLDEITLDENGIIHLGPMVTHNHCVASKLIRENAIPLAIAAWEVGSPQIRNRGTIAGNLVTASPANDTITPLMAMGAEVTLRSLSGQRKIALEDFYVGVRKTVMRPDEMIVDISFPALRASQKGTYIKLALRRAQAISLLNVAVVLRIEGKLIQEASITLGAVAPTIIHASEAETFLAGKSLTDENINQAAELVMAAAKPISDVRASAAYRKTMTKVIAKRALRAIADGSAGKELPETPVLLWGSSGEHHGELDQKALLDRTNKIETMINGKPYRFDNGFNKTLLRLLREDAGLIGTKEGCAEGECGACTVFLDGVAVMSCMVPAPRAHKANIVTVEGLSQNGDLHPVQEAFVEANAVQCGYCTPGFVMSAAKLLEERPTPSQLEIKQAITGNLCRCTGYYSIVTAIETAADKMRKNEQ